MSQPSQHVFTLPSKRRRVLSDIVNTKKSHSLGFDMVNIDHSIVLDETKLKRTSESAIPVPPREKSNEINELALRNKEKSRIPMKVGNYIAMNRSLAEKSKIKLPNFELSYERDRLQENARAEREVESLRENLKAMDKELHEAAKELNALLDENEASQEFNRQLHRRKSELKEQNCAAQKVFDFTEARVNEQVAHKEQMMHLQLREFENKLQDDYNEAKFNLKQQVKESASFQDTELVKESEALSAKKEQLRKKLQETIDRKNEVISKELATMDADLEKALLEKRKEVEKATLEYHEKQLRFEEVMKEYDLLSSEVEERKATASNLNKQMDKLHEKLVNFQSCKHEKEMELQKLNNELRSLQGDDFDWQSKVSVEKDKYEAARLKHDNYMKTRRILEHAIMNYSNKIRLYVRFGGEGVDIVDSTQVIIKEAHYKFDKVMRLSNDESYSLEWKLLLSDALTKNDAALIISGTVPYASTYQLFNSFSYLSENETRLRETGWLVSYSLQSLLIDSSSITDLLNKCTETELEIQGNSLNVVSQRMLVESLSDLKTAVKDVDFEDKTICHILNADAANSKTRKTINHKLYILNLTNLSPAHQSALFSESKNSDLQKILSHITSHVKVLNVCDIMTVNDKTKMLLEKINTFHR